MSTEAKPKETEEAKMDLFEDDDEFEEFEINEGIMAGDKKPTSKEASKSSRSARVASSSEEKVYTSHQSYFTKQEDIDSVLRLFGISGIETRVPGPNDRINTPPEGFFAFTPLHIYHSCYLPFNSIIHNVLSFLKIAPIQLNPNSYSYINSLVILFKELKLEELTPFMLCSLVTLQKLKNQPEGSVYYLSSVNSGVISDFINRPRDWSHQFFFVRCYSSDITGRFSVPAVESKNVDSRVLAKIPSFEDATTFSRSRLRLLTEEKLKKYTLILPTHRVLGEPPMMKRKRNNPPALVVDKLDTFSANSPIQRLTAETRRYSSDHAEVHLVLSPNKGTSKLPASSKETGKVTVSKTTSLFVVSTAEDAIAKAREDMKRKGSKVALTPSEVPSKRPKEPGPTVPSLSVPSSGTDAIVTTLPVQDSSANVSNLSLQESMTSLHRISGLDAPFEDIPPFLPGSGSSYPTNFMDLFMKVLRSSVFASPSSSGTSSLSAESLENLLQHLIQIGWYLFDFQQSCTSSSQDVVKLQELNSYPSEKISTLETQLHDLQFNNELLSSEKTATIASLELEKEKTRMLEERIKLLEEKLVKSRELEERTKSLEEKLSLVQLEKSALEISSTRVLILEKDLDEKNLTIGKLKSSIHTMKARVSSFLSDSLPQWKEQCAEAVLFATYKDNVDRCPDMAFTSFDGLGVDYKKRFDILLGRVLGDYSEVMRDDIIEPAKSLAFDDISTDDDEGSGDEGADKENADSNDDDEDDNDRNDDIDGPVEKDSLGDGNGGIDQGGSGAPQGSDRMSDFLPSETTKGVDKSPLPRHSLSKSTPLESGEIGQTPAEGQLPLEAQTHSDAFPVRSFRPNATVTHP